MRLRVVLLLATILFAGESAFAQKHEFAFTSGGLKIGERGFDLLATRVYSFWYGIYVRDWLRTTLFRCKTGFALL